MELIHQASVMTRLGMFTIRCSDRGVQQIAFGPLRASSDRRSSRSAIDHAGTDSNGRGPRAAQWSRQAARELQEYAAGDRKKFTVPLDLHGTEFQKKVWKALRSIPYGRTKSYGEVARLVGNPLAARAVGMANHENPVAIVVPCHRVIAADGSLGGYAGGLRKKSTILQLEKSNA